MKFLTTAAIALVAATTAQAAEIKRIGGDISITGMITPGDAAKFKAIAANIGGTVILNSPGGYVAEAALISIQVRSQSYATRVPRRAKCDSACALIWLAGIRRELDPRSLVGVHRVRQFGESELKLTDEEANTLAAWAMREFGAPEALVNLALSTDSKSMSYVNYEKAKAWGLLDPPPTPKGIPPAAVKSDLSFASVREQKPAFFRFPGSSMLPTVPVGGLVLVIPTQQLRIGDVVAFYLPKDKSTIYVKRIVGMGGDQIQMRDGILNINGQAVKHERVEDYISVEEGVPEKHMKRYRETLLNGVSHMIIDLVDNGFYDNTPVYKVPPNHYFMMGDNRDNSTDSRVLSQVGYVPVENIIGKAYFVRLPEALK